MTPILIFKVFKMINTKLLYIVPLLFAFLFSSCEQKDKKEIEEISTVTTDSHDSHRDNHETKEGLIYKDFGSKPFVFNIEDYTRGNDNYRTTLWTGEFMQLTVMSILPGEDIGLEVHMDHDQFIRVEEGEGVVQMGDSKDNLSFEKKIEDDFAVMIPAGTWHNVVNNSDKPLKLYSIYSPGEHKFNTVHKTQEEAIADDHDY